MKTFARILALVLAFQIVAPTPSVLAAVTEVPLTVAVGTPRANPLTNTIDVPVTVKNDLGYAVPGPIAVASDADPDPPIPPAPGLFQPYLIGKYGPIYPDGGSAPYPSYVDLPTGLAPGQSATAILRFFNRDDVVADFSGIRTYVYPPSTLGVPPYATTFPTTGGPIDITTGAPINVSSPLPGDVRAWRTVAWRLQLFQYDFDANNLNGGTLGYQIVPVPSLPPSLAGAAFPSSIQIDADGVVRWFPSSTGLYAFRIQVSDGVTAPGGQDIVVDVLDPAAPLAADPLACNSGSFVLPEGTQLVPSPYDVLRPTDPFVVGRANVMVADGRQMGCYPSRDNYMGEGTNTVSCRTNDGLYPADSCTFDVAITKPAPPPVPLPPNLRLDVAGEEKFQNCNLAGDGSLVCDRYLEPTTTDRGVFRARISNDGDLPAPGVVLGFSIPTTPGGAELDPEKWGLVPGRDGTCTQNDVGFMRCEFGDLAPHEGFDVTIIFEPGNDEPLQTYASVWSESFAEDDTSDNLATLTVAQGAGPIEFYQPPPPKQQCEFREDVASVSFGVIWESFRCIGEDMPWVRWFVSGVFAATAIVGGAGAVALASQTVIGGALRASWIFRAGEVVTGLVL